jgi:hypothetical protein
VINILNKIERTIEKSTDIFSDAIEIKKSIDFLSTDEQEIVNHLLVEHRKMCLVNLENINNERLSIVDDDEKLVKQMQLHYQNKRMEEFIELLLQSWDFIEQRKQAARRFQKKMQSSAGCAQILNNNQQHEINRLHFTIYSTLSIFI